MGDGFPERDVGREIEEILTGQEMTRRSSPLGMVLRLPQGRYRIPLPGYEYQDSLYTFPTNWDLRAFMDGDPIQQAYVAFVSRLEILCFEAEKTAASLIHQDGNIQAKWALVAVGLRPLLRWAQTVHSSFPCNRLEIMDLVHEGAIGLLEATDRFDPSLGIFLHYGAFWARQRMQRAVEKSGYVIRVPSHVHTHIHRALALVEEVWRDEGHLLSPGEVAERLEIKEDRLLAGLEATVGLDLDGGLRRPMGTSTWEGLVCSEYWSKSSGDEVLSDIEQPSWEASPSASITRTMLKEDVRRILTTLTQRQRQVLELRYGFDRDGEGRTLDEVGQILGVTRERIRQIEDKALRRLRHPSRSRLLSDYLLEVGSD
ncbi:MAG TPA: sigma-70 family RNA polymerase sigma factor [Bacillota bacterium]|nr:sigma-70 family RNA polymerase sigma factor [Bacillota bacterium]